MICWAAAAKSVANARPASAAPGTLATSATGASETLTPVARSSFADASASARTVPAEACAACERSGGAHGRIRMSPPSWSTQISGGPLAPRRSWAVSSFAWPGSVRLSRNRIAPAARPSPSTSRTYPGALVPAKRRTTSRPTCCESGSSSAALRSAGSGAVGRGRGR